MLRVGAVGCGPIGLIHQRAFQSHKGSRLVGVCDIVFDKARERGALLGVPAFALAVIGIFLYVGAEVCMGRFLLPTVGLFFLTTGGEPGIFGRSFLVTFGRRSLRGAPGRSLRGALRGAGPGAFSCSKNHFTSLSVSRRKCPAGMPRNVRGPIRRRCTLFSRMLRLMKTFRSSRFLPSVNVMTAEWGPRSV